MLGYKCRMASNGKRVPSSTWHLGKIPWGLHGIRTFHHPARGKKSAPLWPLTGAGLVLLVGTTWGILSSRRSIPTFRTTAYCQEPAATGDTIPPAKELDESLAAGDPGDPYYKDYVGRYENRLRAYSHPLKLFQYFASVSKKSTEGPSASGSWVWYMTIDDFIRCLTPYRATMPKAQADEAAAVDSTTAKLHPERMDKAKNFFMAVDMDGDGLISYEEFVLFLTLLSSTFAALGIERLHVSC